MISVIKENRVLIFVFCLLLAHGALLGLSDDEAYYWVLAQKPSFGYAYHPPAVAWMIALTQRIFEAIFGTNSPLLYSTGVVRLPAVLSISVILGMSLSWVKKIENRDVSQLRVGCTLLSFAGFFALGWMMVPDIPLFLGWILLFTGTSSLCIEGSSEGGVSFSRERGADLRLFFGAAGVVLAKFSGILSLVSAGLCLLLWAPPVLRRRALFFLIGGAFLAFLPILVWNAQHEWGPILYQIRDRHGGEVSFLRYARFWGVEALLVGPVALAFLPRVIFRSFRRSLVRSPGGPDRKYFRFILMWILPSAAVFCVQPLFSDFKPHWAFVVWMPLILALSRESLGPSWSWIKVQCCYGIALGVFVLVSCHLPLGGWMIAYSLGPKSDSRLDVTNDLYGWRELPSFFKENLKRSDLELPVVGSRYQTASQAAFGLAEMYPGKVTLLPKDLIEADEWPHLSLTKGTVSNRPVLNQSVLFIKDNRYDGSLPLEGADCRKLARFERTRFRLLAKWIEVWRCDPRIIGF